jgi:hypothetical protein
LVVVLVLLEITVRQLLAVMAAQVEALEQITHLHLQAVRLHQDKGMLVVTVTLRHIHLRVEVVALGQLALMQPQALVVMVERE